MLQAQTFHTLNSKGLTDITIQQSSTTDYQPIKEMIRSALILGLITILPFVSASSKDHINTNYRNNESFTYFHNGKLRDCKYIGFRQYIRERLCTEEVVYENCPLSCGRYCFNDPNFQFKKKSGKGKASCQWIEKKQARKDRYCDKPVSPIQSHSDYQGKVKVRYACPKACGYCDTYSPEIKPASYM